MSLTMAFYLSPDEFYFWISKSKPPDFPASDLVLNAFSVKSDIKGGLDKQWNYLESCGSLFYKTKKHSLTVFDTVWPSGGISLNIA